MNGGALNKTTGHVFHKTNEGVFHKTNGGELIERTEVCQFYTMRSFVWLFAIQFHEAHLHSLFVNSPRSSLQNTIPVVVHSPQFVL